MLTDAWQIPPGSLLLSVVYPLAQIHCASLLPLSHQCGFASCSCTWIPDVVRLMLPPAGLYVKLHPFLASCPFFCGFHSWVFFPEKPSLKSLAHETSSLGLLRGNTDWISFTLQIFRKKIPNMKKEAHLLHGNNTTDKSKQIGKTHLGHVTKHSFPWYIRALESGKSLSLVRLSVTPWTSPWNSPGQNTRLTE